MQQSTIIWYHIGVTQPIVPSQPLPCLPAIPHNALVVVEGRAPIWYYGRAFHALHGKAMAVAVYDPRLGVVIVASHTPLYAEGDVLELEQQSL